MCHVLLYIVLVFLSISARLMRLLFLLAVRERFWSVFVIRETPPVTSALKYIYFYAISPQIFFLFVTLIVNKFICTVFLVLYCYYRCAWIATSAAIFFIFWIPRVYYYSIIIEYYVRSLRPVNFIFVVREYRHCLLIFYIER